MAVALDQGTNSSYFPARNEAGAIALIKEKVIRKSLAGRQETEFENSRRDNNLLNKFGTPGDLMRRARTSILHEDEEEMWTTRNERMQRAMAQSGKKIPVAAAPDEADWSDQRKYFDRLQGAVERKSTKIFTQKHGTKDANGTNFIIDELINDYSRQTETGKRDVMDHIERLRRVARDARAHEKATPKRTKQPLVEKYLHFTVQMGMTAQESSDLNFSPEGKMRRE